MLMLPLRSHLHIPHRKIHQRRIHVCSFPTPSTEYGFNSTEIFREPAQENKPDNIDDELRKIRTFIERFSGEESRNGIFFLVLVLVQSTI